MSPIPPNIDPQIKWPHWYHFEVCESSNKPIMGVLVEPSSHNGFYITELCQISFQTQLLQNEFKNAKFKNPDIDNQMSGTCGQYELLYSS